MLTNLLALLAFAAHAQTPGPCEPGVRNALRPATVGSVVSATYPIKVHWNRAGDEAKGQLVLEYAELAWAEQIDGLGFRPPHLPDTADGDELDIYLTAVGWGSAWADADVWGDQVVGDGYNGTSSYIVIDQDLPEAWVPVYTVHEFNHTLQWATDYSEWTLPLWEGVATASQEWTLKGGEGVWDLDVDSFQEIPWYPTLLGDSYGIYYQIYQGALYEYGSALWVMHLAQVAGAGDTAGVQLWDAAANEGETFEPDVVDAFAAVAGVPLGEALNDLARTRFLAGPDWDSRGLVEAELWTGAQLVPAAAAAYDALPLDHLLEPAPMPTGQAYVELTGLGAAQIGEEVLVVSASSPTGLEAGLMVMWWAADGTFGDEQTYGLDPSVALDVVGVERVVVALTNLGAYDFDPDFSNFYAFGDHTVHLELVAAEIDEPGTDPGTEPGTPTEPDPGGTDQGGPAGDPGASIDEEKGGLCSAVALVPSGTTVLFAFLAALVRRRVGPFAVTSS